MATAGGDSNAGDNGNDAGGMGGPTGNGNGNNNGNGGEGGGAFDDRINNFNNPVNIPAPKAPAPPPIVPWKYNSDWDQRHRLYAPNWDDLSKAHGGYTDPETGERMGPNLFNYNGTIYRYDPATNTYEDRRTGKFIGPNGEDRGSEGILGFTNSSPRISPHDQNAEGVPRGYGGFNPSVGNPTEDWTQYDPIPEGSGPGPGDSNGGADGSGGIAGISGISGSLKKIIEKLRDKITHTQTQFADGRGPERDPFPIRNPVRNDDNRR